MNTLNLAHALFICEHYSLKKNHDTQITLITGHENTLAPSPFKKTSDWSHRLKTWVNIVLASKTLKVLRQDF